MKTLKSEDVQNELSNPKTKKLSPKAKKVLSAIDNEKAELNETGQNVLGSNEAKEKSNKAVHDTKKHLPEYKLVGLMNLRRTAKIADANPHQLVLPNDIHEELMVRGIRLKFTWDEVARAILEDHIRNNRSSNYLFTS